ncbi:MAG: hypothetical protein ABSG82_00680 [Sedimentisphaerales bacterium]|jgi:hypothetical protein
MGKIDLSKLKGMLKVFGVLRPYVVLLWPVVIVLVSVVVLAVSLMIGSSFRQKVDKESTPMAKQVKSLLADSVAAGQAEVEGRYEQAHQEDANQITLLAKESTQRELLSYSIFPKPKESSGLLYTRFGDAFRQGVEKMISDVNGKECPSEEDLKVGSQTGFTASRTFSKALKSGGGDDSRIVEEICQGRAKAASVYASPTDVSGYDFWSQYKYSDVNSAVKDCWFWQLGYWIIEDVFSTVESMNAGSSSVFSSPVKRVMRVGFVSPDKLFSSSDKASQDRPKYAIKPADQLAEACTGRISDDKIDVVHFSFSVVVGTKYVMSFMKELCSVKEHRFAGYTGQDTVRVLKHNQISILESQIKPIDLNAKEHQRYRYGQESVVEVVLVCEYIFNKEGYQEVEPDLETKDTAKKK